MFLDLIGEPLAVVIGMTRIAALFGIVGNDVVDGRSLATAIDGWTSGIVTIQALSLTGKAILTRSV